MKTRKTSTTPAPRSDEQALSRLDQITNAMESGEVSIDQMAEKIQEAQTLLTYCRQKLFDAEKKCKELLDEKE